MGVVVVFGVVVALGVGGGLGSCGGSLAVVVAFRCSSGDGSTDLRLYTSTKLKIVNC